MATYLMLCNFTEQGIRNVKETTNRADAVREMAKRYNVTTKEIYWTLGQYDVAALFDAADDSAITALALTLGAMGNVRTQILRAFTQPEIKSIIGKVGTPEREPANA